MLFTGDLNTHPFWLKACKSVKCFVQEKNTKTLAKAPNIHILLYHSTFQYFLLDNFHYNSYQMPNWWLIAIEPEVRFVRKVEGKLFTPGRFMLSILTDASRRDSANAGGGDWRPSSRSLSGSFCSPWMTANPSLKRSAKDVALNGHDTMLIKNNFYTFISEVWLSFF